MIPWNNESVCLDGDLKIKVDHCDLYFEDFLMYKHDTLFFYPFIFI